MGGFSTMLLCTAVAGLCIGAGALVARAEKIQPRWLETEFRHSVIAFGGGVLTAAVALVLVPEGSRYVTSPSLSTTLFVLGGLVFFAIERYLGMRERQTPQLMAMLLDFLPESLALGGMFAIGAPAAPLLAILIGLQNLPEGFNTYRELSSSHRANTGRLLAGLFLVALLGPVCGVIGWSFGADHKPLIGGVMLFAAGGILYLLFQDIAPQSRVKRHWAPALGAVAGFAVGMAGHLLVNG
jgi:ZIP family zinc transporter